MLLPDQPPAVTSGPVRGSTAYPSHLGLPGSPQPALQNAPECPESTALAPTMSWNVSNLQRSQNGAASARGARPHGTSAPFLHPLSGATAATAAGRLRFATDCAAGSRQQPPVLHFVLRAALGSTPGLPVSSATLAAGRTGWGHSSLPGASKREPVGQTPACAAPRATAGRVNPNSHAPRGQQRGEATRGSPRPEGAKSWAGVG